MCPGSLYGPQGTFSDLHGVEDSSLLMMFIGDLPGATYQPGIFRNYLAWYEWYMNYHSPIVGSCTERSIHFRIYIPMDLVYMVIYPAVRSIGDQNLEFTLVNLGPTPI